MASYTLTSGTGALSLSGVSARVARGWRIRPYSRSFTASHNAAQLAAGRRAFAAGTSFALGASAATSSRTYSIQSVANPYSLAGVNAVVRANRTIGSNSAVFQWTALPLAGFIDGYSISSAAAPFLLTGGTALLPFNARTLEAEAAAFRLSAGESRVRRLPPSLLGGSLQKGLAQERPLPYGGSDPTLPSFLRPYYVKYNSINKSRDLGETEILIADFSGQIGSQAGSNTLFFKVHLLRDLDLRVVKHDTGSVTDKYISVGILDANRKPIPMTDKGYGYLNDIHNTVIDESKARLPEGTYYITVSSSQWQSIPYSFTLFVGSYALLSGDATGRLIATGRLPLIKPIGQLLGTAPLELTVVNPGTVKNLTPLTIFGGPQAEFLTPGTYTWIAPAGVTSVSAVCVGGGGGGGNAWSNAAGSGGGLGWRNNIPVTPGAAYTVVVGAGGLRSSLTAGGNSYFISLDTVAGYGGGNQSSGQDTNGPNKNSKGGGWFGDGGGAGGYASSYIAGGGAGGYTGNGGNPNTDGSGGGAGGGRSYSTTYGTGAGGGTGIYGQGPDGLNGRSRDGTLWPGAAVNGFGGSGGSTATGINGVITGTGGRQGETAAYGQPYGSSITGGFPGGGGGGSGTSFGGGNGGGGAVRLIWGAGRAFPATNAADIADQGQTFAGGSAPLSLTLTIMRGVAIGQMLPTARLKQTWRIAGTATGADQSSATLSSEAPYGGGYGY